MSASPNSICDPSLAFVPNELKRLPNWVVWKFETRDGNLTKPLYDAKQNGKHVYAKTNDATTWASFARATEVTDILSGSDYEGIGFVFTDTDYVGIDLDGVVHDAVDPFAVELMKLVNSYCEFSPSGSGVHVIFESSLPLPKGHRKGNKKLGGEIYNKTSPRYFTVTGNKVDGLSTDAVAKIDDPDKIDLIHFMVLHLHDTKLTTLWMGDLSLWGPHAKYPSQSEADQALCSLLAPMLNYDAQKIEKYFGASKLGQRDKWTTREEYRTSTIKLAIGNHKPASNEPAARAETFTESGTSPTSSGVEEYEAANTAILEYPQMGNDMLSQYASLLTQGTAIPFGHVRECLKNFLAFCLSDDTRYPNHEKLYLRGWHFNLGEPETCKTEALIRVKDRWDHVLTDLGIWIDKLSSYGSLQYLTKGFEDHERMFLYVTEGNTLANANEHVAAIFSGLSDLYDQPVISAGSFRNKGARCANAKGSCIVCFTPDDFIKAMQGKGVIGGGVLPRWTLSCSEKIHVDGDWPSPPEAALRMLQQKILDRVNGVDVVETDEAQAIRIALTKELERPEAGRHGKRLIEHYKRECLLAAVFAESRTGAGVITKEVAVWAAKWTRYQLHLRITYWPIDAGNDVERMCTAMRGLLKRAHPKGVSLAKLKDTANVYREGSGGVEAFGRAYRAMMANEDMRKIGQNAKGKDLFGLMSD